MKYFLLIIGLFLMVFTGCRTTNLGPQALRKTHYNYNQEAINTSNEQLLSNIVRVRYRDNPYFFRINTITHSQSWLRNASLGFEVKTDPAPTSIKISPNVGTSFEEKPTIVYTPLDGQEFVRRLMTPVQTTIVLSLIQDGWRLDRIFGICVERINSLKNATTASGPTPTMAPDYKKFKQFVELLKILYQNHLVEIGEDPVHAFPEKLLRIKNDDRFLKEIAELKRLTDLATNQTDYKIKSNFYEIWPRNPLKRLAVRCRSLMGILHFLSYGVEVPAQDENAGLVTIMKNSDGTKFDWEDVSNGFFRVYHSEAIEKPKDAFTAIRYRNKWFYIADNDLETKTTFMLLTQLFNLQSTPLKSNEPILTLPVR